VATEAKRAFVARLSVLEAEGAIVRPVVSKDGRRIKIVAESERQALTSAIRYLGERFGLLNERERACALGASAIGRPFVDTRARM
jgi:hypothetical protein